MTPYYVDDSVTLWHGDCREITDWLSADVLVTDPPYGIGWEQGGMGARRRDINAARYSRNAGIANDHDTSARDQVLAAWGARPAVVFGSLMLAPPAGTKQVLVYRKPPDAGARGATAGFQRDAEAIYLVGPWPSGIGGRTSVLSSGARMVGGTHGLGARHGHPHAKPVDLIEVLLERCPPGVVADPFAGSCSTLVAARNVGRPSIGVELEARHCVTGVRRLAQDVLPIGGAS